MIPWFITSAADWVAKQFGYECHVLARQGAWGVDKFWIVKSGAYSTVRLKG